MLVNSLQSANPSQRVTKQFISSNIIFISQEHWISFGLIGTIRFETKVSSRHAHCPSFLNCPQHSDLALLMGIDFNTSPFVQMHSIFGLQPCKITKLTFFLLFFTHEKDNLVISHENRLKKKKCIWVKWECENQFPFIWWGGSNLLKISFSLAYLVKKR